MSITQTFVGSLANSQTDSGGSQAPHLWCCYSVPLLPQPPTGTVSAGFRKGIIRGFHSAAMLERILGTHNRHEDGESSSRGSPGPLGEHWAKGLAPAPDPSL